MRCKLTLDFVKNEYKKENFEFLDNEYKNSIYGHRVKCLKCGYERKQKYGNFSQGQRCPKCSKRLKYTLQEIQDLCTKNHCIFLDKEYKNAHHLHNLKCTVCGLVRTQNIQDLRHGKGCKKCAVEKRKQTCLEKYGQDNPMKHKEIARSCARSQAITTIHYHWRTGEELECQRSYEEAVVYHLNSLRIDYLWQPEVFQLSTGKTYRPDLYLIDEDKWIEIKGYFRKDALEKWEEFHNKIKTNSELWDQEKLKELNIL
jgi:hypothetical protein